MLPLPLLIATPMPLLIAAPLPLLIAAPLPPLIAAPLPPLASILTTGVSGNAESEYLWCIDPLDGEPWGCEGCVPRRASGHD